MTTEPVQELQSSKYGRSEAIVWAKKPPPVRCKMTSRWRYWPLDPTKLLGWLTVLVSPSVSVSSAIVESCDRIGDESPDRTFAWRCRTAASSGAGSFDRIKQGTPHKTMRSATEAPFTSREACNIRSFSTGRETIPLHRDIRLIQNTSNSLA